MASDQDVYRKVGRGGAGNYHATDKSNTANNDPDLEAQSNGTAPAPPPTSSTHHGTASVRAGRGGAGNYVSPADLPGAQEQRELAARVSASLKKHPHSASGLGGRGGAGNWRTQPGQDGEGQDGEEKKHHNDVEEEMERRAREEVERELKMPERAHRGLERNKEDEE